MILNDEKLLLLVEGYEGRPVAPECILYAAATNKNKKAHKSLIGIFVLLLVWCAIFFSSEVLFALHPLRPFIVGVLCGISSGVYFLMWFNSVISGVVVTLTQDVISLYMLNPRASAVVNRLDMQIEATAVYRRLFKNYEIRLAHEAITLTVSKKTLGVKKQSENVEKFVSLIGSDS